MSSRSRVDSSRQQEHFRPSRRALVKGAAWAAPVAAFSVGAPAMAFSPSCESDSVFDSQSRARMISGSIFGTNLDGLAEVEGVHAQAFLPAAPGADGSVSDVDYSPLNVQALGLIELELGGVATTVSSLLAGLVAQDAGAVNQYAFAHEAVGAPDVAEVGAAGTVDQNSGAITLDDDDPGAPELASLDLYTLLQQATGDSDVASLITSVADLQLQIGAVAGRAFLDMECNTATNQLEEQVDRDYVVAYLRLLLESEVVAALGPALTSALPTFTVNTDAVWDAIEAVPGVGPLLTFLAGGVLTVDTTIDTSMLLTPPQIPADESSAIRLDVDAGTIVVDVANLLGSAYPGTPTEWLNSRSANTRLFVDADLPTDPALVLVDILIDDLVERLKDLVSVNLEVRGRLTGALLLEVQGSLRDLLEGTASANAIGFDLSPIVNTLLPAIGNAIQSQLVDLLRTTLSGVNDLLSGLFDVLEGVLAITLNAQNQAGGSMPEYYAAITPGRRYDVGALHLELLGFGDLLNLSIARGSVGQNDYRDGSAPTF